MTNAEIMALNILRLKIVNKGKTPRTIDNVVFIDEDGTDLTLYVGCNGMKPCPREGIEFGTKEYVKTCKKCRAFWLLQPYEG